MSDTRSVTGEKIARPAGLFGWVCFDWAVIPCFGLINIFIFAPYFTQRVVGNAVRGQVLWGYTQATAGLLIALVSPFLGAISDAMGPRKPWIGFFGILAAVAMTGLWGAHPGATHGIAPIILSVVVLSIGIEYMVVFHNAMLPSLVEERKLGTWSGLSFAIGYIGTIVALLIAKQLFSGDMTAFSALGLTPADKERAVGPLMAAWLTVFILPLFFLAPDRESRNIKYRAAVREGVGRLLTTIRRTSHYKNVWLYFIARMIFYDGLLAVFIFSGVFAAGLFGWRTPQLAVLGIALFAAAAIGAIVGGVLDDRIGSKNTLFLSVAGVAVATVGLLSIEPTRILFWSVASSAKTATAGSSLFPTLAEKVYVAIAAVSGFFTGPALASSRTMVARLAPRNLMTQFFGLFSLMGRATAFLAPLAIGLVTAYSGSQRLGFSVVLIFMFVGLCLLAFVHEERAEEYRAADDPPR